MHKLFTLVGRKPATGRMTVRALHKLIPDVNDGRVRVTACGRRSRGGGIGKQILSFSGETGGDFEATEYAPAVTCRKCLKAMDREKLA